MEIRTKSQKLLTNEATISTIEQILVSANAKDEVFFALHSPEKICQKYNLDYTGETAIKFANELRYQYEQEFPEKPLRFEVEFNRWFNSKESEAFQTLLVKMPSAFLAYRIIEAINEYSYLDIPTLERASYLLGSKPKNYPPVSQEHQNASAERNWFGGLRSIFSINQNTKAHSYNIAQLLKPYHEEISKLFDEFMTLKYPEFNCNTQSKEGKCVEKNEQKAPELPKFMVTESKDDIPFPVFIPARTLSPEDILKNEEPIRHFLAYANKLKNVGISPETLLEKECEVMDFLKASKKLIS